MACLRSLNDMLLSHLLQTVWIVDSITWTVLWPMIEQTTSGLQRVLLCRPDGAGTLQPAVCSTSAHAAAQLGKCYMFPLASIGAELERLRGLFFCFTSYMQHGGNAILVLVEFALNDIR